MEEKQISLQETEIPQFLTTFQQQAHQLIQDQNYQQALTFLKRQEQILESITTQGAKTRPSQILVLLNNLSLIYQRTGDLQKCEAYLQASIFNASSFSAIKPGFGIESQIKKTRFISKSYIQLCAVLSQQKRHKQGLEVAKKACKFSKQALQITLQAQKLQTLKYKALKKRNAFISEQLKKAMRIIKFSEEAFKIIEYFLKKKKMPTQPLQIRSVLGVKGYPDWVHTFTIADMMFIQPLKIEDLEQSFGLQAEFTKDQLLEKICVLALSYFCISTQQRYYKMEKQFFTTEGGNTKRYHLKALALLLRFFPAESPLVKHLQESLESRLKELQRIVRFSQPEIEEIEKLPNLRPPSITPPIIDILKRKKRPKSSVGIYKGYKTRRNMSGFQSKRRISQRNRQNETHLN